MAKAKNTKPNTPAAPAASIPAPAPPQAERSEFKGSGTAKSASREITQEQIARRAFEIYAGRGYAPGDQHADWLEAERQLKAGL
jgi:hypothetical protein